MEISQSDRRHSLEKIYELQSKPGGNQAIRYALNALGSVPLAGGLIAGAGNLWGEKEQQAINKELENWANLADEQLNQLVSLIELLQNKPSATAFALLIPSIIGRTPKEGESIPVVLNPATVEELQPYVQKEWLSLKSTGSICTMGCGSRVGNHIEELKRPWGMGNGFIMTIAKYNSLTE